MRSVIVQLVRFVLFLKPDFIVAHKERVLNIRHSNRHGSGPRGLPVGFHLLRYLVLFTVELSPFYILIYMFQEMMHR